ncbi:uncharacterized protein LOC105210303 isoform X2 [Zeugodacus cucurbitae]|uniref:uncharacterized protein LOC105210303 isoform X2 n=1 Tax=Zeugodacus cucurbitae TaxID=28588 RepID=UPI0023D919D2|nr:uncharacterized protein LOC105210303 isoform X2 [Zeugodacus cucurbitae]
MEKIVEIYSSYNNKRRIFHARLRKELTALATNTREENLKCNNKNNYNKTTTAHNENSGQQQKQQSNQRLSATLREQRYYVRNVCATAATTQQIQQQQQQPQLTPTVDYFRFSALYALVTTTATAAACNMRATYACVTAYDEAVDDEDAVINDYMPHNHDTRQRCVHDNRSILHLKRSHKSLTQTHCSKYLRRTTCHRSGSSGARHVAANAADTDADDVSSCGLYSALATATGSSTTCAGSGLDTRSIFYLTLVFFIYCTVMMRASVAATAIANATMQSNNSNNVERTNEALSSAAAALLSFSAEPIAGNVAKKTQNGRVIDKRVQAVTAFAPSVSAPKTMHSSKTKPSPVVVFNVTTATVNGSLLAGADASADYMVYANDTGVAKVQRVAKRDTAHVPDDEDDSAYRDDEFDEYEALINNRSAKGKYIGAPCFSDMTCETTLIHVTCDKETKICGCERNYPVQLGLTKGCDKPKKLGEQCFYDETCMYSDENSLCVQVRHNAMCQCADGFHSVSHTKPTRRVFCTKDLKELNSDLPTLLGVATGIAVLTGLICMVLHLFTKTKYPRPRNFGDANLPPPIMYSSETVQSGRPSSRSSLRSSGSIGSYGNRRASSGGATAGVHGMGGVGGVGGIGGSSGTKGILVSTSRTGSRRPSLASVHSTSSSVRSYSMMRFEKEVQQKEIRQEMKLRLARLQQQQHLNQNKPQIVIGDTLQHHMSAASALSRLSGMPTPSPLTPNSTDELLPSVDELQEYPPRTEDLATTIHKMAADSVAASTLTAIKQAAIGTSIALTTTMGATTMATGMAASGGGGSLMTPGTPSDMMGAAAYIGPCSSSTDTL